MRCNRGKKYSEEHRRKILKALKDKIFFYIWKASFGRN